MDFKLEVSHLTAEEARLGVTNLRKIISEEEKAVLENQYSNLPNEFLDYLSEIGSGTVLESNFKVYSGLVDFNDLGLEEPDSDFGNVLFFGDNLAGDLAGFDLNTNSNEVIEYWHDSYELINTKKTFRQFVRDKIQFDPNDQ